MKERIENYLKSVLPIPFEILDIDIYKFSVKKSDLAEYGYNEEKIRSILRPQFPWNMAYDWTKDTVKFTLC